MSYKEGTLAALPQRRTLTDALLPTSNNASKQWKHGILKTRDFFLSGRREAKSYVY